MHLLDRAVLPTSVRPCLTPPRRKRHALNTLKVVFSTAGDLIKVHSYGDHCSATWDTALTYGCLEPEGGNGTVVAIRPDERAWLDSIRTLAAEWLAAVEAADRSWIAQAATCIQRYDNQSDGLIVLSQGMELALQVPRSTIEYLEERNVVVHVAPTRDAVRIYNELVETTTIGGLFHSTC